jgi:hypothetical protein
MNWLAVNGATSIGAGLTIVYLDRRNNPIPCPLAISTVASIICQQLPEAQQILESNRKSQD